jgi:hypothetical protein
VDNSGTRHQASGKSSHTGGENHHPIITAGNPVERPIEFAPVLAPAPQNPEWISSDWCGDRLQLDWIHLVIDDLETRATARQVT